MEKSCRKYVPKTGLWPLFNNGKQPLHTIDSFKIRYFKRGLPKSLKKLTLFFLLNPVPFNEQDYEKQKGPAGIYPRIFTNVRFGTKIEISVS